MPTAEALHFLLIGYLITIAIETPILLIGLSPRHPLRRRLFAGLWLSACTYPIVILLLPEFLDPHWLYLTVAETFAPIAECALFHVAFTQPRPSRRDFWRDCTIIVIANLASFAAGELMYLAQ